MGGREGGTVFSHPVHVLLIILTRGWYGLLQVEKWFGSKKELASVRSCCSHIKNMQIGTFP
jgi:hypothetical protein